MDPESNFRPNRSDRSDVCPLSRPDVRPRPSGDELASQITHELRGPLYALNGWLHLLSAERALSPEQSRRAAEGARVAVESQVRQIDALGRVLRHLLDGPLLMPSNETGGRAPFQTPALAGLQEVLTGLQEGLPEASPPGSTDPEEAAPTPRLQIQALRLADGHVSWPTLRGEAHELIRSLSAFVGLALRHGEAAGPVRLYWGLDCANPEFCELILEVDEGDRERSIWQAFAGDGTRLPLELFAAVLAIESAGGRVWPQVGSSGIGQLHLRLPLACPRKDG